MRALRSAGMGVKHHGRFFRRVMRFRCGVSHDATVGSCIGCGARNCKYSQ
jgi:hypothetical protein